MKKLILLASVLFLAVIVHGQGKSFSILYNMAGGDTTITIGGLSGYIYSSWQMTATSLDAATATFTLQKSNDAINYGDIPAATATFASGNSVRFIEFADPSSNSDYRLLIVANTVTAGTLNIIANFIQK